MLKIIENEKEYNDAINRIEKIFDSKPGTIEFEELRVLSVLIEKYESEKYPIREANPVELIKFKMDQLNIKTGDLVNEGIFSRITAWRIFNYKTHISRNLANKLSVRLNIPLELLLKPYNAKETQIVVEVKGVHKKNIEVHEITLPPINFDVLLNKPLFYYVDEDNPKVHVPKFKKSNKHLEFSDNLN